MTIEFKPKADQYCQLNVKADVDRLFIDIFKRSQYIRTIEIDMMGEKIA